MLMLRLDKRSMKVPTSGMAMATKNACFHEQGCPLALWLPMPTSSLEEKFFSSTGPWEIEIEL